MPVVMRCKHSPLHSAQEATPGRGPHDYHPYSEGKPQLGNHTPSAMIDMQLCKYANLYSVALNISWQRETPCRALQTSSGNCSRDPGTAASVLSCHTPELPMPQTLTERPLQRPAGSCPKRMNKAFALADDVKHNNMGRAQPSGRT